MKTALTCTESGTDMLIWNWQNAIVIIYEASNFKQKLNTTEVVSSVDRVTTTLTDFRNNGSIYIKSTLQFTPSGNFISANVSCNKERRLVKITGIVTLLLPTRASEQGNVIGLVSVYIKKKLRTRDLIYLKFVATDFSPKKLAPVLVKTPVTQHSPYYSAGSALLTNSLPYHSNYSPLSHTHYLTPAGSSG